MDNQLPLRKRAYLAQLPRRTRSAPLPDRGRTLHRLQTVPISLSRPRYHDRNRTPPRQLQENHQIRHRYDQVHLLWILLRGLSSGCHCRGKAKRNFRDPIMSLLLIPMRNCSIINRNCWRMEISGSPSWLGILNILSTEDDFIYNY